MPGVPSAFVGHFLPWRTLAFLVGLSREVDAFLPVSDGIVGPVDGIAPPQIA